MFSWGMSIKHAAHAPHCRTRAEDSVYLAASDPESLMNTAFGHRMRRMHPNVELSNVFGGVAFFLKLGPPPPEAK
jgi:hypothetical protein